VSIAGLAFGVNVTRTRLTETIRPTNPKDILESWTRASSRAVSADHGRSSTTRWSKTTISNRTGQHVSRKTIETN